MDVRNQETATTSKSPSHFHPFPPILYVPPSLAESPPIGVKTGAFCWQDSSTAGNAQCTLDCVAVTALNGSSVYPVGCDFTKANATGAPTSVSLSLPSRTGSMSVSVSTSATKATATGGVGAVGAGSRTLKIAGLGLGIGMLVL